MKQKFSTPDAMWFFITDKQDSMFITIKNGVTLWEVFRSTRKYFDSSKYVVHGPFDSEKEAIDACKTYFDNMKDDGQYGLNRLKILKKDKVKRDKSRTVDKKA